MPLKPTRRSFIRAAATSIAAPSLWACSPSLAQTTSAPATTVDAATALVSSSNEAYCRLFKDLPAAKFPNNELELLACGDNKNLSGISAAPETLKDSQGRPKRDAAGKLIISATPENELDDEENFATPVGYTYLGQFIDHDLTLNPVDHFNPLARATDTPNLRSCELDLDNLYGAGPGMVPYMYSPDGRSLVTGRPLTFDGKASKVRDLPRLNGRAVIGDKRNDENVIVSQLHSAFIEFHNAVAKEDRQADFEQLRRTVTLHYQWLILTDFLPKVVGQQMMDSVLPGFGQDGKVGTGKPKLTVAASMKPGEMPVEFVDAVYRAAHSAVRPSYRLNTMMRGTEEERRLNPDLAGRKQIFAASAFAGLNGFREYPSNWGIDWQLYFEIDRKLSFETISDGPKRVQASYKLDTSLVNPLAYLPEFSQAVGRGDYAHSKDGYPLAKPGLISNLAYRDLLRGNQRELPSGQAVAIAMGLEPIESKHLMVGKASVDGLEENKSVLDYGDSFKKETPLWFYILAEAQALWNEQAMALSTASEDRRNAIPNYLGPVGGRLMAETFVALLANDPKSILYAGANWQPRYLRQERFDMAALLTRAGVA
jgi:hypothetical protein